MSDGRASKPCTAGMHMTVSPSHFRMRKVSIAPWTRQAIRRGSFTSV
jgi:hypothetical protein